MVQTRAVVEIAHDTEMLLGDVRDGGRCFNDVCAQLVQVLRTLTCFQVNLIQEASGNQGHLRRVAGQAKHRRRSQSLHKGEKVE